MKGEFIDSISSRRSAPGIGERRDDAEMQKLGRVRRFLKAGERRGGAANGVIRLLVSGELLLLEGHTPHVAGHAHC